ncbi:hypothetical protein QFC19_008163 [Naganishia cerealis]|uniref:Uncharacterized protein n=1 Tax=Naganishia cerealis TaxID=610337 RepID=A0ACC2V4L7_9TREE|nr:hypothetical protein QFC19_008163 [Naganishia cerealis]
MVILPCSGALLLGESGQEETPNHQELMDKAKSAEEVALNRARRALGKPTQGHKEILELTKSVEESLNAALERTRGEVEAQAFQDIMPVSVSARPDTDENLADFALSSLGNITAMSTGDRAFEESSQYKTLNDNPDLMETVRRDMVKMDALLEKNRESQEAFKILLKESHPDQPSFVTDENPVELSQSPLADMTAMSTGDPESGEAADPSAISEEKEPADQESIIAGKQKERKRKPKKQIDSSTQTTSQKSGHGGSTTTGSVITSAATANTNVV